VAWSYPTANRIGYGQFTAAQLKVIQEVITLLVFVAFAWCYLDERLRWNEGTAFALVLGAVVRRPLAGRAGCGEAGAIERGRGRQDLPGNRGQNFQV